VLQSNHQTGVTGPATGDVEESLPRKDGGGGKRIDNMRDWLHSLCEMDISTEEKGRVTIVRIDGAIDMLSSIQLRDVMKNTIAQGRLHIAVDLSKVTHVDSSGFGVLIRWDGSLRDSGGEMRLFGVPGAVRKILGDRMETYETAEQAIMDFQ